MMYIPSLLCPPRCPVCDGVTDVLTPQIHQACRRMLPVCTEPRCVVCGRGLVSDRDLICRDCAGMQHSFVQGRALWYYSGAAKQSLYRYKFANRRQYASFYALEMLRAMGGWLMSRRANALIPVPVSAKKLRARGYNQSALLARALSCHTGIPVREDILKRRSGFRAQKELSRQMRRMNLQRAFYTEDCGNIPGIVILIDDIYTTGSTLDAASEALKRAGVQTIYAAYICVGET